MTIVIRNCLACGRFVVSELFSRNSGYCEDHKPRIYKVRTIMEVTTHVVGFDKDDALRIVRLQQPVNATIITNDVTYVKDDDHA